MRKMIDPDRLAKLLATPPDPARSALSEFHMLMMQRAMAAMGPKNDEARELCEIGSRWPLSDRPIRNEPRQALLQDRAFCRLRERPDATALADAVTPYLPRCVADDPFHCPRSSNDEDHDQRSHAVQSP